MGEQPLPRQGWTVKGASRATTQRIRIAAIRQGRTVGQVVNEALATWLAQEEEEREMRHQCTTIRDAYEHYADLCGATEAPRTLEELRDVIHERGLRYEELDGAFWDSLFATGWADGRSEDPLAQD